MYTRGGEAGLGIGGGDSVRRACDETGSTEKSVQIGARNHH